MALVEICGLRKTYRDTGSEVKALDGVDLNLAQGSFTTIEGPSGSGKTTLLMAMGGMLHPSEGSVTIDGVSVYELSGRARAAFRAKSIGFVFQAYHLVPYLTVVDNVRLASRGPRAEAITILERLGMGARTDHLPAQLSAGERQRTGLARAVINRPPLILADEPTGNLDEANAEAIYTLLDEYRRDGGTVAVVTHGKLAGRFADRRLQMNLGKLETQDGLSRS